jgi:quinol monooxygenase YgiN
VVQLQLKLTSPPGRVQQTIQALRSVMLPARLEQGMANVHLSSEVGDGNVLFYVEEWADVESLIKHIRLPRFAWMLALMETAAEAPTLEFRFVSQVRGLDYVAEVRGDSRPADRP